MRENQEKGQLFVRSSVFPEDTALFTISHVAAAVREQGEARLRQASLGGHFAPGTRLIERDRCHLSGEGRTSLREALRQLEEDGPGTNIPHKGIIVPTLTSEEAQEVYEVRAMIEGTPGRLCTKRLTPTPGKALTTALEQIAETLRIYNLAALAAAKAPFDHRLLSGCRNHTASVVSRSLHNRTASSRALRLAQPGHAGASIAQRRQILLAILAADSSAYHTCIAHGQKGAQIAPGVF